MTPEQIALMTNSKDLRSLMDNARRLKRDDVYWHAFRRLCALEGLVYDDPLDRGFYGMLNAYELLLTEKNGRTTPASRTRQKLKNKGVVQCLIDWALGPPTDGFNLLTQNGMPELTAEYLVLKFSDRFPENVVHAARERLKEAGVELPTPPPGTDE